MIKYTEYTKGYNITRERSNFGNILYEGYGYYSELPRHLEVFVNIIMNAESLIIIDKRKNIRSKKRKVNFQFPFNEIEAVFKGNYTGYNCYTGIFLKNSSHFCIGFLGNDSINSYLNNVASNQNNRYIYQQEIGKYAKLAEERWDPFFICKSNKEEILEAEKILQKVLSSPGSYEGLMSEPRKMNDIFYHILKIQVNKFKKEKELADKIKFQTINNIFYLVISPKTKISALIALKCPSCQAPLKYMPPCNCEHCGIMIKLKKDGEIVSMV